MIYHIHNLESERFKSGVTATIGSFDGVHIAHKQIIKKLIERSRQNNTQSAVITFSPHPRVVLEGENCTLKLLSSLQEKSIQLEKLGVENLIVLPFTEALRSLTAKEFTEQILIDKLNVKSMFVGYNNKIGCDRASSFHFLSTQTQIEVELIEKISTTDNKINSTLIRNLISSGEIEDANKILGHNYNIICKIDAHSKAIIEDKNKLLPPEGRYSGYFEQIEVEMSVTEDNFLIINKILGDCINYSNHYKIEFTKKLH
ncbi:MAG: hypothetical protein R3Y04_06765 [Rikenellaceae bacterium]